METLSVRDYRNNLAASFARAENGEKVFIRRKNKIFALVSIGKEDLLMSHELSQKIEEARLEFNERKTRHFDDAKSMVRWMEEL